MDALLQSWDFWFGAALLCAFQIGKFGELDDGLKKQAAVPDLRASDFLGHTPYVLVLVLFVAVTLAGYMMLCLASPTVIMGWMQVTGGTADIDKITRSPYPLWLAAGFMGLTHQAIPGFEKVANIQRNVFHELVGVPRYVIDAASSFSGKILAYAAGDRLMLARRLGMLCSDQWRVSIEPIADTRFFQTELQRLKLDGDDLEEALTASPRELRTWLRQVVYLACIATMRRGGREGFISLAGRLGVDARLRGPKLSDLVGPAFISAAILTFLMFLVPMADEMVAELVGQPVDKLFWPHGKTAIIQSAIYLMGQVLPVLIAATILASAPLRQTGNSQPGTLLVENAGTYVAIVASVFLFTCVQTLWDYGRNNFRLDGLGLFFGNQGSYFLLQALVSLAVCLTIQWRSSQRLTAPCSQRILDCLLAVLVAVAGSAFYAWARLKYWFDPPKAYDFLLLVIILNGVAGAIAFVACRSVWRRQAARDSDVSAPPAPALPAPPSPVLGALGEPDPLTTD